MQTKEKDDTVIDFPTEEQWVISEAQRGVSIIEEGLDRAEEGWLVYGAALNVGRAMFPGKENDRAFGEWVSANLAYIHPHDRAAAMWAAENPEQYKFFKLKFPKVRTVRGLYAKFNIPTAPATIKEVEPTEEVSVPNIEQVRKLQTLADHPNTDPGTKANAERKLEHIEDEVIRDLTTKIMTADTDTQRRFIALFVRRSKYDLVGKIENLQKIIRGI